MPRWIHKWQVASRSNPDKTYTVARDAAGHYGCSCPHWINRLQKTGGECHHIKQVIAGRGEQHSTIKAPLELMPPEIRPANVKEVTLQEVFGKPILLVPLIPLGNTHFAATVLYDLLRQGHSWTALKQRYDLAKHNTRGRIVDYVRGRGRMIVDVPDGPQTTYTIVSVSVPDGL